MLPGSSCSAVAMSSVTRYRMKLTLDPVELRISSRNALSNVRLSSRRVGQLAGGHKQRS